MGKPDPYRMAERMSSRLLTEWQAYYRLQRARAKDAARNRGL